jgi:hypothetical protein
MFRPSCTAYIAMQQVGVVGLDTQVLSENYFSHAQDQLVTQIERCEDRVCECYLPQKRVCRKTAWLVRLSHLACGACDRVEDCDINIFNVASTYI